MRDKAIDFLTKGNRPVFDDEVEPEFKDLFNAFEYVEYPENLRSKGEATINAYFFMGSNFTDDLQDFFDCLQNAGALNVFATIEADDYEELIIMDNNGQAKTLGNEYRKIMKFIDVTDDKDFDDDETIEDDLAEIYQRLEQVKTRYLSEHQ